MNEASLPEQSKIQFSTGLFLGATVVGIILSLLASTKFGLIAALIIPATIGLVFATLSLEFATYLTIFALFTQFANGLDLPGGFFFITVYFLFVIFLHQFLTQDNTFYISKQTPIVFLFIFSLLVSIIDSAAPEVSYTALVEYMKSILLYFIFSNIINNEHFLKRVALMIIFSILVSTFYGYFVFLSEFAQGDYLSAGFRLRGLMGNPNHFGLNLIIVTTFLCYFALTFRLSKVQNTILMFTVFGLLISIASTFSRAAIIAVAVLICILSWQYRRKIWPVALLCALLIAIIIFIPPEMVDRMTVIMNPEQDPSLRWRLKLYLGAIDLIQQNPITGIGLGNFLPLSVNYIGRYLVVHNSFLELWAECGFIALAAFVALFWSSNKMLRQTIFNYSKSNNKMMIVIAMTLKTLLVPFAISAMFNSIQSYNILWSIFAFATVLFRLSKEDEAGTGRLQDMRTATLPPS